MYEVSAYITKGNVREKNDDRISVCGNTISDGEFSTKTNCVISAVFDGVGGEAFGNEAAQAAADSLSQYCNEDAEATEAFAFKLVSEADNAVKNVRKIDDAHSNAAATMAGVIIANNKVCFCNLGDSKVFFFRSSYIFPKSKDHTEFQEYVDMGLADIRHPRKSAITRYLGNETFTDNTPYIGVEEYTQGDIWLICSDGLSDFLSYEEMEEILLDDTTLGNKTKTLVELALANGSDDNVSAILVKGE